MKRLAILLVLIALATCSLPSTSQAEKPPAPSVPQIICQVFGSYCSQALRVAYCESKYYVWAGNGQYQGIFQMGSSERARYGHGPGAWAQARAAYRYFVASGRDWSPWTCRP